MTSTVVAQELWHLKGPNEIGRKFGRLPSLEHAEQPLTNELADELAVRGLQVRRRDPQSDLALQRAGVLIGRVPSLECIVLECVSELLVLNAPDEWHDVSHSEPRWPHRIFVSLPPPSPVGDIRLAEAVVHEAMHLNLSFVERYTPLIADDEQLYSPWRFGDRPAGGVLHGIYVFATLMRFFEELGQQEGLSPEQRNHLIGRRAGILEECRQVSRSDLWRSLTEDGRIIAVRIFELIDH
jgi:HEXXH motif-containing protein